MTVLIGADEAGYGPNLGPLVVAATVWQVPDGVAAEQMYDLLRNHVAPAAGDSKADSTDDRLVIADSKTLYQPGGGWERLERGVLPALRVIDRGVSQWRRIWENLDSSADEYLDCTPWHERFDLPLPHFLPPDEIDRVTDRLQAAANETSVRLISLAARVVFPGPFNRLLHQLGNKAELLSITTLELVKELLASPPVAQLGESNFLITCDKHGGRGKYAGLLQHVFDEGWVDVRREGREESVYQLGPPNRRLEFRFLAKGERMLPTALASMLAKYLRELAMLPFNQFWRGQVPGLAPTAGYPLDAKRFYQEISPVLRRLGIDKGLVWREK